MAVLTKKQELAIQYKLDGCTKTQAVLRAYSCKDNHTASALADKLFKQAKVVNRLAEKQAMVDSVSVDKIIDFRTQLLDKIPSARIIKHIEKHLDCGDKRVEANARNDWLRATGSIYEKDKVAVGLFKDV